jgi:signal transduction histidine kinase
VSTAILALAVRQEHDVVAARQRARHAAELLGFDAQQQTRISTAVSEIARNAFRYAGGGRMEVRVEGAPPRQSLRVRVADEGPGIADLDAVLEGRYRSETGMGMGLAGTRRLMDHFRVESGPGGTTVEFGKALPPGRGLGAAELARVAGELARRRPGSPFDEIQRQNQELLQALDELRAREHDLLRLNQELEDTNRGVVALYAELDESVAQLRRTSAQRAQVLSYMSHEFRTPLDSMIALTGLLLARVDGELTSEQEKQVGYVQRSARDLLNLVDDLLDTARVEAGQVAVRPAPFTVADLFRALQATLRPLRTRERVALVFEEAPGVPALDTDESKVSQVLRNLVSNALKFTESGEVRIAALPAGDGRVDFRVSDTGVGIPEADLERIWEDFAQVENSVQRRVKGTGLGLPLSRKLAGLLGGTLTVTSTPGAGSVFSLVLPVAYRGADGAPADGAKQHERA